jgi:hypothetical protein
MGTNTYIIKNGTITIVNKVFFDIVNNTIDKYSIL